MFRFICDIFRHISPACGLKVALAIQKRLGAVFVDSNPLPHVPTRPGPDKTISGPLLQPCVCHWPVKCTCFIVTYASLLVGIFMFLLSPSHITLCVLSCLLLRRFTPSDLSAAVVPLMTNLCGMCVVSSSYYVPVFMTTVMANVRVRCIENRVL